MRMVSSCNRCRRGAIRHGRCATGFSSRHKSQSHAYSNKMYALVLVLLAVSVVIAQPGADLLPVQQESLDVPLKAIGQLTNGCTGYLIGPCHVMTVAHCVHEPWRDIWWRGLDFHPGRNLASKDVGSSPLGSAPKADVRLHPNWTRTAAASASDAAIIITSIPIGRKVGWFRHKPPAYITQQQQQKQEQSAVQARLQSAEGLNALVSQQQLTLHIAGYPDDKQNGSMWQQCCSVLDWQLQGDLLWHDCYARGGNSGSPVWVVWPSEQKSNSSSGKSALSWDQFQAVGVHSSSLKFPSDSQVGLYTEELYAQSVARAQQRQAAAAAGQAVPTCTAATSSFTAAPKVVSAAGTPVALPGKARTEAGAAVAGQTQATSTAVGSGAGMKAGQTAAATPVGPSVSKTGAATAGGTSGPATGRKRRRALLAGAGGRQEDGLTLLPVAVPFAGDTYAWIEQVLKEFEQCPGE